MKIKKYLLFLIMGVMLSGLGMAVDQGINGSIGDDIVYSITPTTINFGSVMPGTNTNPALNGLIAFNVSGSNLNITIEVTNVSGVPFDNGLKLDGAAPVGRTFFLPCVIVSDICTYSIVTTTPTLNVPKGSPAGIKTGTITYLITGVPPI